MNKADSMSHVNPVNAVNPVTNVSGHVERRSMHRHCTFEAHGIASIRVRPGQDVSLVDVSGSGALVETTHQLHLGSSIEVHMSTGEGRLAVRGHVVRCSVSTLRAGGVWYRGAISFDHRHPWFVENAERGYPMPVAEVWPHRHGRADASRPVL